MKNQFKYKFEQWLYHSKIFTSFYGQLAGNASSAVFWRNLEKDFLNFIPEGGKILEIGSGPGFQAMKILQHRPDVQIIASDFSDEMISLGEKNYQELILRDEQIRRIQSNLSFVQADAMDLSQFGSETFDGIYSLTAIKHFPDPIRGLNECIRILKPGKRMLFSEFFVEASIAEAMNLAKHLRAAEFIKPIIVNLIHLGFKNAAPGKADVEKWKNELCLKGVSHLEYLQGYPFFVLNFEKNLSSS